MLSARYDNFPLLKLTNVHEVFTDVIPLASSQVVTEVIEQYKTLRPESCSIDFCMNRTHLLEVILLLCSGSRSFAECLSDYCQRYFVPYTTNA